MKYNIKFIVYTLFVMSLLLAIGCSETKDNITNNESQGIHGDRSLDPNSTNFHGYYLSYLEKDFDACKQCHGGDFEGGVTNQSCTGCHVPIAIHQEGIVSSDSVNFHPNYMHKNDHEMNSCSQCHGDDYTGGLSSPTCDNCHSGIPVHVNGILDKSSPNWHGNFVKNIGWDLNQCSQCHGEDYSGGLITPSCNGCHSGNNGPESCNTCHGDFNNPDFIAPPQDLWDNTESSSAGVGSHTSHMYENTLSSQPSNCFSCHQNNFTEEGTLSHIVNGGKATIEFDEFSTSEISDPIYDVTNYTCANTYCHGNFDFNGIVGNNKTVTFNIVDGSQAECGTCHGQVIDESLTPLPTGHLGAWTINQCFICHPSVVNAEGEIIDKLKHINKMADF